MNREGRQTITGPIRADMKVDMVIKRYPKIATVLLKRAMNCPGCHISRFHDLQTVSEKYGVDLETLIMELNETVEQFQADHESV